MFTDRPQPGEDEEDLINFQNRFLASGEKPCVKLIKCENKFSDNNTAKSDASKPNGFDSEMYGTRTDAITSNQYANSTFNDKEMEEQLNKCDTHVTTVLSNIIHEKTPSFKPVFPTFKQFANPQANQCKKKLIKNKKPKKKSLFAQQFSCKNEKVTSSSKHDKQIDINDLEKMFSKSKIITGEGLKQSDNSGRDGKAVQAIHVENIKRLSLMSAVDIQDEQNKLEESLDPKLLSFLKKRKQHADVSHQVTESKKRIVGSISEAESVIQANTKWVHMDKVEREKIKWMENTLVSDKVKEIHLPNRFDFEGNLLSFDKSESIPSHLGLHHHNDDPDLAGYTLQELMLLSRSQFPQQQVLALKMFSKIIRKDKKGDYVKTLSQFVSPLLLECGLAFILRWALDQQSSSCIQIAIDSLHSLFYPGDMQERFLDEHFLTYRGCEFPCFQPFPNDKSSKDENDHELLARDLVKGFVQTNVLCRIRYVLEVCQPDSSVIIKCLQILQRFSQHSTEIAVSILNCPRLMKFIVKNYLPLAVFSEDDSSLITDTSLTCGNALRLLRMLCQAGRHITSRIIYEFDHLKSILIKYFIVKVMEKDAVCLAELEAWKLWSVFLSYGFYLEFYRNLAPTLILQLQKCVELVMNDCSELMLKWVEHFLKALTCLFNNISLPYEPNKDTSLHWSEIKELHSQVKILVHWVVVKVIACEKENHQKLFGILAAGLNIMTTYLEKSHQIFQNLAAEIVLIIEPLFHVVANCGNVLKISVDNTLSNDVLKCLPDLCLNRLNGEIAEKFFSSLVKINLITSFCSCAVTVCKVDRSCCTKFITFFEYWCKMDCNDEIYNNDLSNFYNRIAQHCIYMLVKLFVACVIELPVLLSFVAYFHSLGFLCISIIGSGEEEYCRCLLNNLIFCPDMLKDCKLSDVTNFNVTIVNGIRATYLSLLSPSMKSLNLSKSLVSQIPQKMASFLLPPDHGPLLPTDWPFLPILDCYDKAVHEGESDHESSAQSLLCSIKYSLYFLYFLEKHRRKFWKRVNVTSKFVRMMCLYMADSSMFFDDDIRYLMTMLFKLYAKCDQRLDFDSLVPGVTSFYDFYMALLDQFEAVSYGDVLFSAVVLLPIIASSSRKLKLALWVEHSEALRIISIRESDLLLPKETFLMPPEGDFEVVFAYTKALASGQCQKAKSPFLYHLAVHHVTSYLSDKNHPEYLQQKVLLGVKKLNILSSEMDT